MRDIDDRGVIYNNVKICITNKCKIRVNKINIDKWGNEKREKIEVERNGHGGKGDASILGVEKIVSSNLTVRRRIGNDEI